jgi:hypothetical protein
MPVTFDFETDTAGRRGIAIERLVVAGWTARDRAALDHHIEELAALGVPAPSSVPLFYRNAVTLLTQASRIEVLGNETSGEVEPVLLDDGETLWLGLGSDHTDRGLEAVSVAASKQACAKILAPALWRLDAALTDRLDTLELASWIDEGAGWTPYQQGTFAAIRPLAELVDASPFGRAGRLEAGTLMMCGTLGAKEGVRPARHFRMALRDPATGRTITHEYEATPLPVIA